MKKLFETIDIISTLRHSQCDLRASHLEETKRTVHEHKSFLHASSASSASLQITNQEKADHRTYLMSHRHLYPGEQVFRAYEPDFDATKCFGTKTLHRNDGIFVKKNLSWLGENDKTTPLVSKRLDAFRERTQPELGRTLDP